VLEFPGFAEPQTARRQKFFYGNRSAVRLMLAPIGVYGFIDLFINSCFPPDAAVSIWDFLYW
jgi:hypothetical protein